jgi:hypothetical protein
MIGAVQYLMKSGGEGFNSYNRMANFVSHKNDIHIAAGGLQALTSTLLYSWGWEVTLWIFLGC